MTPFGEFGPIGELSEEFEVLGTVAEVGSWGAEAVGLEAPLPPSVPGGEETTFVKDRVASPEGGAPLDNGELGLGTR